jgi:hypothetical protein
MMTRIPRYVLVILIIGILIASGIALFRSFRPVSTLFEDVTLYSGISYTGMTHGAAWSDYDGDGLPDLYVTNHLKSSQLFRNLGKGHFSDQTQGVFQESDLGGDKHGAAWADFDNDGRLDLVQLTGAGRGVGSEPKRLFLNRGNKFEDVAESLGVANIYGRTRMPLWIDLNGDGRLDLFQGAEARFDERTPPMTFLWQDGRFAEAPEALNFADKSVPFCILTELNKDSHPELVCKVEAKNQASQLLDTSILPARDLDLLPATAFEDIAAGDFDNDGAIDLFLVRKNPPGMVAFGQLGSNEFIADISIDDKNFNKPAGFEFRSPGQVSFRIAAAHSSGALSVERIHIGLIGQHPSSLTFTLSPETAGISGIAPYQSGVQAGVHIGFAAPDKWQVFISGAPELASGGKDNCQQIALKINSSVPVTKLVTIGAPISQEEAPARLLMNRGGKLVEESDKRGVNDRLVAASNVVAGDFDNDMDLDLFVLVSGEIGKQKNLLLLNDGKGYFNETSDAGGAAGGLVGVGDSVTTADFDRDGFLDLLMSTGGSMGRSLGLPSEGGAYYLYRNISNGNHWLEIDLEGTVSNRDGIGAVVRVTAGGITQVRVQDGGIHHRGQNHKRLHFGLAKQTKIDKITVSWPNGTVQEMSDIKTDQVLRIKESAS